MSSRQSGRAALAVLCFALVYLPLEEFLLKWAPGGSLGYAALRLGFEGVVAAAALALAAARVVGGLPLRATAIDVPLAAFCVLAAGSLFLSDGARLAGFLNLRVLLRYVVVFYLVSWLAPDARERRTLLVLLLASAALQAGLGLVQHFQGGASAFWLPRTDLRAVGGVEHTFAAAAGGLEQGAVLGTTDHSVAFALYLLVAATLAGALYLTEAVRGARGKWLLALVALACAGLFFSYVRSCLFALVVTLALLAWRLRGGAPLRRLAPAAVLCVPLVLGLLLFARFDEATFAREKETRVSPFASVAMLFTPEYRQAAESSRLWVLRDVGSEIARSAGWLGFGPDQDNAKRRLLDSGGASLHRLIAYRAFEDVYWVALLAYYGFLGLGLLACVLVRLAPAALRACRAEDPWERASGQTLFALLVVLVPLGFLTPVLDFRTFAFPFWMLAGLVAGSAPPATVAPRARVALATVRTA